MLTNGRGHRPVCSYLFLTLAAFAPGGAIILAQVKAGSEEVVPGLPAALSGFSDKGEFRLYVNEDPILTTTYEWRKDGSIEEEVTLSMAGQKVESSLKIIADGEGRMTRITATTPQGPQTFERDGTTLRFTFKDKTLTLTMRPETVLF